MAVELLPFHRAVITGHNRGWMSGIDAEPLVPHSKTERSVATWREERRSEGEATWKQTFHLVSVLFPSSSPLPFPLCPPLSSSGTGFGSGFVFFDSISLFPPALLPWLQHHAYMKCICVPGMGPKGLVGLRTGWLYMTGCGGIMGTPPI